MTTHGDYPTGCTQADHDAAFDWPKTGPSERAVDERALELACEDFDNMSVAAQDWIDDALTELPEWIIDVVREAVSYIANPAGGLYSKGQLDDAVGSLRAQYADKHADLFRDQAWGELSDWCEE